nr:MULTISPECIES: YcxB family protein [unclassified Novosphingobium]
MTYADYLAANRLRAKSRWTVAASLRFILPVGAVYLAIIFLTSEYPAFSWTKLLDDAIIAFAAATGAYAGLLLSVLLLLPRTAKKLYAQQPSASSPYQFSFDSEGLHSVGPFETANLPWSHISGWLENDRLLLLCKTRLTFFCLPKAQLGEANLAALKQCLNLAGVKQGL